MMVSIDESSSLIMVHTVSLDLRNIGQDSEMLQTPGTSRCELGIYSDFALQAIHWQVHTAKDGHQIVHCRPFKCTRPWMD